ncbi:MAG: 3-deoxy-manno-octulosonate cytidylyltransferase [Bdellovibrionales bacterium]|nr:3-deoxy-manno-octulosonate cytidylyltransferase [Bdellovibrionales bacterium]
MKALTVATVIPARYSAQRLPGKPLADIHGKPMIQHVYERAARANGVSLTGVATDDPRIAEAVERFGGKVWMTSPELQSGTDRVAAVARMHPEIDIFVNVQGDEPLMDPRAIEAGVELVRWGRFNMSTVMTPMKDVADLSNAAVVKVIADDLGRAIYFSRHPIPYSRKLAPDPGEPFVCRRHVGLYVYRRETLLQFSTLPPCLMERAESLEQLRALQAGISIGISEVDFLSIGVDTPEELEKVRQIISSGKA